MEDWKRLTRGAPYRRTGSGTNRSKIRNDKGF